MSDLVRNPEDPFSHNEAHIHSQVDDMRSELYAKEGEIKILRDKLSGQESELHKMKSEKIGQIAQQNKQQKDKEKGLQVSHVMRKTFFRVSDQV